MSVLSAAYMHDEAAAFAHVESILWQDGPVCPHCGCIDRAYRLEGVRTKPSKKNPEGKERHGLWKCRECRKQFTVRKGTIFEESHLPLYLWLQAIHLMVSSKKGISSHQLHRVLGITYKSAWFLTHRIRECMRSDSAFDFGAGGKTVEVDETFIGWEPGAKERLKATGKQPSLKDKMKVLTLVERETGQAKSIVIDSLRKYDLVPILLENISREAVVYTDEGYQYRDLHLEFAEHQSVNHSKEEWMRGKVGTNVIEGYFSIFKRGMKGVYQHCSKQHLHRYAAEFEFRYNNRIANGTDDKERGALALRGAAGKRLTYSGPDL